MYVSTWLILCIGLAVASCTDSRTPQEKKDSVPAVVFGYPQDGKDGVPSVAFGYPYMPEPGKKLPKDIVLIYLDGPVIECERRELKVEEITGYVTELAIQKNAQMVFIFTTADVQYGRVIQVVDALRKVPVKWIRIDDRNIAYGYRYPI